MEADLVGRIVALSVRWTHNASHVGKHSDGLRVA